MTKKGLFFVLTILEKEMNEIKSNVVSGPVCIMIMYMY